MLCIYAHIFSHLRFLATVSSGMMLFLALGFFLNCLSQCRASSGLPCWAFSPSEPGYFDVAYTEPCPTSSPPSTQGYASVLQKWNNSTSTAIDNSQFSNEYYAAVGPLSQDMFGITSFQNEDGVLINPSVSSESIFFNEGVQSFSYFEQLESEYKVFFGPSTQNTFKLNFLQKILFVYKGLMNPQFFEDNVWVPLGYDTTGSHCTLNDKSSSTSCLQFPFTTHYEYSTDTSDYTFDSTINEYTRALLGSTYVSDDREVTAFANAVTSKMFSCNTTSCGILAGQNTTDASFLQNLFHLQADDSSFAEEGSSGSNGLFLKDVAFFIKNNDNAKNPQQYSYKSNSLAVKRSFPSRLSVRPDSYACWHSPVGFYNDYRYTNGHPFLPWQSEHNCFYTLVIANNSKELSVISASAGVTYDNNTTSNDITECEITSGGNHIEITCYCNPQNTVPCNTNPLEVPKFFQKLDDFMSGDLTTFNYSTPSFEFESSVNNVTVLNISASTGNLTNFFDDVHCALVEYPSEVGDIETIVAEKPVFNDPREKMCSDDNNGILGLTNDQINTWCGCADTQADTQAECNGTRSSARYSLCAFVNGSCKMRTGPEYYLDSLETRDEDTTVEFSPQCYTWDPELDEMWKCQRPDRFTGCVIMTTVDLSSSGDLTNVSLTSSHSLNIPVSLERFGGYSVTPERYYLPDVANLTVNESTTCAFARYVDQKGKVTNLTTDTDYHYTSGSITLNTPINISVFLYQTTPRAAYQLSFRCYNDSEDDIGVTPSIPSISPKKTTEPQMLGSYEKYVQSCVPFTNKVVLNSSSYRTLIGEKKIYRTAPFNCVAIDNSISVQIEYGETFTDYCTVASMLSGQNELSYVSSSVMDDAVNTKTQVKESTIWSNIGAIHGPQYYFFSPNNLPEDTMYSKCPGENTSDIPEPCPAPENGLKPYYLSEFNNATTHCMTARTCYSSEFSIPDCDDDVDNCVFALDSTYITPCSLLTGTTWGQCQKPIMQNLFPRWDPDNPTESLTPFPYPDNLYKTWTRNLDDPSITTSEMQKTLTFTQRYWNSYLPNVHYCDRYLNETFKNGTYGGYVYCDNDPMSIQERHAFCSNYQPNIVFAGLTLVQFQLEDVCPFVQNPGLSQVCFVIPGTPGLGTLKQLLAIQSDSNGNAIDFTGTTFYMVPFSVSIMQHILMDAMYADVLISNEFQPNDLQFPTQQDVDTFGSNAKRTLGPTVTIINGSKTKFMELHKVCQRNIPMSVTTITLLYEIIEQFKDDDGVYRPVSLETINSVDFNEQPTISFSEEEVYPPLSEIGVRVPYDDITIQPALPTRPVVYEAIPAAAQRTGDLTCTRFFVDGKNFKLSGFTFDQSGCSNVPQYDRTPIVFNGGLAQNADISDITVMNAETAVSFIGADSTEYNYQPLIDVSGASVSNVQFQYSSKTDATNNYVYAALARATGTATVAFCDTFTDSDSVHFSTCVARANITKECVPPGSCISIEKLHMAPPSTSMDVLAASINATTNPCCKDQNHRWNVIYNPKCPSFLMCAYKDDNSEHVFYKSTLLPNSGILCSEPYCNCEVNEPCARIANEESHIAQMRCPTPTGFENFDQTFQYDTASVLSYDHINAELLPGTLGVGHFEYWWTIDITKIDSTSTVLGTPIVVMQASDSKAVYFEPLTNSEYGAPVRLQLNTDQFYTDAVSNGHLPPEFFKNPQYFEDLFGASKWCAYLNETSQRFILAGCDQGTYFYIDATDSRVHVSGRPFMCPSTEYVYNMPSPLQYMPCAPCATGMDQHIPCGTNKSYTQWFTNCNQTHVTPVSGHSSINITNIPRTNGIILYTDDLCIVYGENSCYTYEMGTTLIPKACDPCTWETLQLKDVLETACRSAQGGQRLACSAHASGGLYRLEGDESAVCGSREGEPINLDGTNGIGARGICVDDAVSITQRGYGYVSGEPILSTLKAVTKKAVIQPYDGTSFNINSPNLQVLVVVVDLLGVKSDCGMCRCLMLRSTHLYLEEPWNNLYFEHRQILKHHMLSATYYLELQTYF